MPEAPRKTSILVRLDADLLAAVDRRVGLIGEPSRNAWVVRVLQRAISNPPTVAREGL